MYTILINKIRCKKCGDIIESTHRHDFKWCSCKAVAVDGGSSYLKRCAKDLNDYEELAETKEKINKIDCEGCIYWSPGVNEALPVCDLRGELCKDIEDRDWCFIEN